jgi:hypothetical protein
MGVQGRSPCRGRGVPALPFSPTGESSYEPADER